MSSEIVTRVPERVARLRSAAARRELRALAIQLIGPLTVLGGVVWAVAQPYRISLVHVGDRDIYHLLVQGPLLVALVGAVYAIFVAPGLVRDLQAGEHDPAP